MKKITKKFRKETVRSILDSYPLDQDLSADDLKLLNDMIQYPGVIRAWKQVNAKYPKETRHMWVEMDTGEITSLSWVKAIDQPPADQQAKKTLRSIISTDLKDFLDCQEDQFCSDCFSPDDLTVDHVDVPFDDIANEFLALHPDIEFIDSPDGVGNIFKDINLEAEWITHHASNATYQILCRSCNAKKGKR